MDIKTLLGIDDESIIQGIVDDSREVKEGYLFVATKGYYVDHYDYIEDAVKRGCIFLVVDREIPFSFPHIVVENINKVYQELCIKFYDIDFSQFHFIGITGTDGKTTTATIVKEIIGDCAYIGTNGCKIENMTLSIHNTTPCMSEFCQMLKEIKKKNIFTISMEVSSEALLHNRVEFCQYDIVAYTNIAGDHLNVHKTFENYVQCKMKLLDMVKQNGFVIVNGDDRILQTIHCQKMYTFGFDKDNDFIIDNVKQLSKYVKITLRDSIKKYIIKSPLWGKFNVYNVVEAFLIGLFYGVEEKVLLKRIQNLFPVSGRCEFLNFGQNFTIVLDYAHTVQAISTILDTFQTYENIIVVTGAAGGREKEKRPIIGKLVLEKSNVAIFTMDDPRYEKVEDIIDEMVGDSPKAIRIINREEAIYYALSIATKKSIVLILGKGRDSYMAVQDQRIVYSDYDVIKKYFQDRE